MFITVAISDCIDFLLDTLCSYIGHIGINVPDLPSAFARFKKLNVPVIENHITGKTICQQVYFENSIWQLQKIFLYSLSKHIYTKHNYFFHFFFLSEKTQIEAIVILIRIIKIATEKGNRA